MTPTVIGNANLFLRTGRNMEADALVIEFHYSGRPPANVQQVVTWHEDFERPKQIQAVLV